MHESLNTPVTITMNADQWAKVAAAVAVSRLELHEKEFLNSKIFDCVSRLDRIAA